MATLQKRNIFRHDDFNLEHILRLAESLRRRPCSCNESQIPKVGALNWVIFLAFDDGVEWVFRAPCSSSTVTHDLTKRLLASEVATLKYIKKQTSIPVPEVFHYSASYDNDIGLPYILMSKAAGHPLAKREWQKRAHDYPSPDKSETLPQALTGEEKMKIMRQLGCYARQLFSLCFPAIGSLFEGDEGYFISECLAPGHILADRATIDDIPRGPFLKEADYYDSLATALHLHAEQLPMGHHVLRAPIPIHQEYGSFAKYYSATDRWNDFAALGGMVESSMNRLHPGFPLHHHDISVQNLFVDDDMNITCIIDWAFASTVPQAQVLATPGLPHPRDLVLDSSLVRAFRSGFEDENRKMGGCTIEPELWTAGEMVSRFMRLTNLDALQDYNHLEALCTLASGSPSHEKDGEDSNILSTILATRATSLDALKLAHELAADDEPESEIRRREKAYFHAVGAKRLSLARKVAVAAKMNPQFVADGRLWRWIDAVLEDVDGEDPDGSLGKYMEDKLQDC